MQNSRNYEQLVRNIAEAILAAKKHKTDVPLKQNTDVELEATLAVIIGDGTNPGTKAKYTTAKAERIAATAALRLAAAEGRRLAMACVNTLKPVLGYSWNSAWNKAGFVDGSLRIPKMPGPILQQLGLYYLANPSREVREVNGYNCTAADCTAAYQALSNAESAADLSWGKAGQARQELEASVAAGYERLTGLRHELEQLLEDDDPRWRDFGFRVPATPRTPEVPEHCTVSPGPASGKLFTEWPEVEGAESFRVRVVLGEKELVNEIVEASEFMARDLPSGSTVQVTVSSRQGTAESQPCAPVSAVVP